MILSFATAFGIMFSSTVSAQNDVPLGGPVDRSTHLTFSGPVTLPHVSLPAGTYLFRFVDVNKSNVVQVLSDDGKTPYAMMNTIPIERAKRESENAPVVTFKEALTDAPAAIDAWFFSDTVGCEMIY
jgi:hypothetical protein